jgi:hypothetical protein
MMHKFSCPVVLAALFWLALPASAGAEMVCLESTTVEEYYAAVPRANATKRTFLVSDERGSPVEIISRYLSDAGAVLAESRWDLDTNKTTYWLSTQENTQ